MGRRYAKARTGLLALLTWLTVLAAGPARAAEDGPTICERPHVEGYHHIVMLLWRGPTQVEAGFLSYVRENDLPFNVTCLSAERDAEKLPGMVARAKALRPDLIYTWGTSVTLATLGEYDAVAPDRHVVDIPVIFTMVSYPAKSRIVPSFESSGRNATGATHVVPLEAQIRAMQAYRPVQRLGVVYNPLESNSVLNVRQLKELGQRRGFEVLAAPVELDAQGAPMPESLPRLIAELAAQEPQFLYIGPDTFIGQNRETVIGTALEHGVPTFTSTELEILRGRAMVGLVTRYVNLGRYMAHLAERVLLEGVAPSDIPVSTLSRFTYAVRLSVAAELELYPPMKVLNYAHVLDRAEQ